MKRFIKLLVLLLALLGSVSFTWAQFQTGVTAEALGQANVRAAASVDSERVGEITNGTVYPVIGRNSQVP